MKRLQEMNVPELKSACKNLQIARYSKMRKNDLIETLTGGYDPGTYMFEV